MMNEDTDWVAFALEWRQGYAYKTYQIAQGDSGPSNVDIINRENLDSMLSSPKWAHIGHLWNEQTRQELNLVWHRLKGWPDVVDGLNSLKKQAIIATLSNGNIRLLVDMAKAANLPWDVIFSSELFGTFKPNPKAYQEAIRHLSLPANNCAMVAAHIHDLRAAASQRMVTVYIRRPSEDSSLQDIKEKSQAGEVDYVVNSLTELAEIFAARAA